MGSVDDSSITQESSSVGGRRQPKQGLNQGGFRGEFTDRFALHQPVQYL